MVGSKGVWGRVSESGVCLRRAWACEELPSSGRVEDEGCPAQRRQGLATGLASAVSLSARTVMARLTWPSLRHDREYARISVAVI